MFVVISLTITVMSHLQDEPEPDERRKREAKPCGSDDNNWR